ncbi:MAG: hypothetical protein ACLT8E_05480 [Akkermansia sp.]
MNTAAVFHIRAPQWNMAVMSQQEIPLPRVLKDAGYRTITVGKAHFAPSNQLYSNPANLGFDVNIAGRSADSPPPTGGISWLREQCS